MNIYVASYFNTRARLYPIVREIRGLGHTVTSSWLDEPRGDRGPDAQTKTSDYTPDELAGFARRDLREIRESDLIIVDTFDETPRGGREVELGYMMHQLGSYSWQVGPRRNVFHYIVDRHFETWEEVLDALRKTD